MILSASATWCLHVVLWSFAAHCLQIALKSLHHSMLLLRVQFHCLLQLGVCKSHWSGWVNVALRCCSARSFIVFCTLLFANRKLALMSSWWFFAFLARPSPLKFAFKKASKSYFLWLWRRDPVLEQVLGQGRAEMIWVSWARTSHLMSSLLFSALLSWSRLFSSLLMSSERLSSLLNSSELFSFQLFSASPFYAACLNSALLSSSPLFSCQVVSHHPIPSHLSLSQLFSDFLGSSQLFAVHVSSSHVFSSLFPSAHIF